MISCSETFDEYELAGVAVRNLRRFIPLETSSSFMVLSLHLSLPPHHQTKQTKHTLSHRELLNKVERHSQGERKEEGGTFSQEVKGQGPLNQHFGLLKLTAITSQTHTHSL